MKPLRRWLCRCAFGISAALATVSAAHALEIPPHDGWVLDRTFGTRDTTSTPLLTNGRDITVSAAGDLFAIGPSENRVTRFAANGQVSTLNLQMTTGVRGLAVRGTTLFVGEVGGILAYDLVGNQITSFDPVAGYDPSPVRPSVDVATGALYVSDEKTVHRYDASNAYLGSWGVVPEFGGFVGCEKVAPFWDGNVLVGRGARVYLFTPAGSFIREIGPIPTLFGISTRSGLISERDRIYDGFGNEVGALPTLAVWTASAWGPDGTLYTVNNNGSFPFQVFKFRPSYRTPATLAGGGSVPVAQVAAVQPRAGTTIVDIDYTIHDVDSASVTTATLALIGGTYSISAARRMPTLLEGTAANIGTGIGANVLKRVTWDAGADLSGAGSTAQARILVLANDGRGLIDIHYITLPANIPNSGDPELLVSDTPITDADMLNAWLWLIARGDAQLALSGDNVVKVGGVDAGTVFATGTTTTAAGRAHLFARLNVREATPAEISRASTGTTPGIQQYEPIKRVGRRPVKINEVGFDTGASVGYWVVPL